MILRTRECAPFDIFRRECEMRRPKRSVWTPTDLKQLKRMAGRLSASRIARELRRSEGAVRVRASQEGVSLRMRTA